MQGFKMGKTKIPEDIKKLTFEEALAELGDARLAQRVASQMLMEALSQSANISNVELKKAS